MFGEISIWAWMGFAIVFGIGGGTGFFISRQIKDKRTLELEEKLTSARNELAGYRGDVNQHFLKTSLLLGKLTNDYREVYEHLATGAQKLCNEKPNTPKLDLPDNKILPSMDVVEAEEPAIELAAETMVEVPVEVTEEPNTDMEQAVETSAKNTEQIQDDSAGEATVVEAGKETAEETVEETSVTAESSAEPDTELTGKEAGRPAPEDIPDSEDNDDDVHLGAESAPSVDNELHKTHQSIH
jgi:uncharacterized membrane-anchored protein YhcB (DUF1043 family)